MRILVIEDDRSISKLVLQRLSEEGYAADSCPDGETGLEYAEGTSYDCILLDLMLPKKTGLEVLERLRHDGNNAYILIMTALGSVEDRVKGLDFGADDYLVKPFSLDELMARIRALKRRSADSSRSRILSLDDLEVDTVSRTVKRSGKPVELTSREYALLEYLMRNAGTVLTRTQIDEHVWDYSFYTESNIVDVYIRYLRNKIDRGFQNSLIHTVRGTGYVMRKDADL